jgi:hypothetical protein
VDVLGLQSQLVTYKPFPRMARALHAAAHLHGAVAAHPAWDPHSVIIDAAEHRTLLNFETFFSMGVWFACFPPNEPHTCLLVLNRTLAGLPVTRRKGEDAIAVPLTRMRLADARRDFMAAVMGAISFR